MELWSPAFEAGGELPVRFTKDGEGWAPPLEWSDVPRGTRELVVLFEEPREPFVYWAVYGIAPQMKGLPEGIRYAREPSPEAVRQGTNSVGNVGYEPPLGTAGRIHRYRLRLLALDEPLGLDAGAIPETVKRKVAGHILADAELPVLYERARE